MEERIQFVDRNDQPVGAGTREEAWANGYYQRLVIIILKNTDGKILLQKRSESKKVYPGAWTASATGHVDEGESYEIAAIRELKEEIGLEAEITLLGKFLSEDMIGDKDVRMFNAVFVGIVSNDIDIKIDESEVSDIRWMSIEDLKNQINTNPDEYTPSIKESVRLFLTK